MWRRRNIFMVCGSGRPAASRGTAKIARMKILRRRHMPDSAPFLRDPAARFAGDGCFDLDLRADRATARSAAATSFRPGSATSTIRISTPP
jgi:hypothetical protein